MLVPMQKPYIILYYIELHIIRNTYIINLWFELFFSKKALSIVEPFTLLSFRFLIAFIIMSLVVFCGIIKINYKGKNIKNLLMLGLMQPVIYFIFETFGIQFSSSSEAGLMIALKHCSVLLYFSLLVESYLLCL